MNQEHGITSSLLLWEYPPRSIRPQQYQITATYQRLSLPASVTYAPIYTMSFKGTEDSHTHLPIAGCHTEGILLVEAVAVVRTLEQDTLEQAAKRCSMMQLRPEERGHRNLEESPRSLVGGHRSPAEEDSLVDHMVETAPEVGMCCIRSQGFALGGLVSARTSGGSTRSLIPDAASHQRP